MKRIIFTLLILLMVFSLVWAQDGPVKVIYPTKMDVSPALRDLARPVKKHRRTRPRQMPNRFSRKNRGLEKGANAVDPVAQLTNGTLSPANLLSSWAGLKNDDNSGLVAPPDPNLAVGPNHVVQMVNLVYGIWDKGGTMLLGPAANNTLWTGFGGGCEFGNDGDPVVVYDQHADRWLLSQFDFSTAQCIAISTTPDPTGTYYRYSFPTPGNDYPKMSLWNDAYLATIRNFSAFTMDAHVFERNVMLVGGANPAMAVFSMGGLGPNDGFLTADIDGPLAPAGTDAPVMGYVTGPSRLVMYEININVANIGGSTISGPTFFPVSTFDINTGAIPQRNVTQNLDALSFATMFRLSYRNRGTHQSMVLNHSVDVGDFNNHTGMRWYEMRDSGGGWSMFQEGSYAPDCDNRWMGSIAMNVDGDILAGYSVSSNAQYPSIRFAGRRDGDPAGLFTLKEGVLIDGLGSQQAPSRWGDYSSVVIDPSNDRTFWYTTEYYPTTQNWRWFTQIGSMDLSTPDIEVSAIPDTPPVIVPTTGGSFGYTINIDNNTASSKTVDVWAYAARDATGGGRTDHVFIQSGVTIGAGQTQTFNVTQNTPPADPANYCYYVKAGTLVDAAIAGDVFPLSIVLNPAPNSETALTKQGVTGEWPTAFLKGQESGESFASAVPELISLEDNYPNPFNPTTTISYNIKDASHVKLSIFNMLGQEVKTLVNEFQPARSQPYTVSWNATNNAGQTVSAGVYIYKLVAGDIVKTRKMTLAK